MFRVWGQGYMHIFQDRAVICNEGAGESSAFVLPII